MVLVVQSDVKKAQHPTGGDMPRLLFPPQNRKQSSVPLLTRPGCGAPSLRPTSSAQNCGNYVTKHRSKHAPLEG